MGRIAEGTGLPSVPVYLLDATTDKVLRSVNTDKDGFFTITEVPVGNYRLGLDVVGASLANTATSISITPQNPVLEVSAVVSESSSGTPVVGLEVEVVTALEKGNPVIKVFPNPIDSEIRILCACPGNQLIRTFLFDLNGKQMRKVSHQPTDLQTEIILPVGDLDLSQGMYLLQINQGNLSAVIKVLKR